MLKLVMTSTRGNETRNIFSANGRLIRHVTKNLGNGKYDGRLELVDTLSQRKRIVKKFDVAPSNSIIFCELAERLFVTAFKR